MLSKYLICTLEQYNQGIKEGVKLEEDVSKHSPVYSPEGSEVLVKGIGDMGMEDVESYVSANWDYLEEV